MNIVSRTYMRLDERPESYIKGKRPPFNDKREYFSRYSDLKYEHRVHVVASICILIFIIGLVTLTLSILHLVGAIDIASVFKGTDLCKWLSDNSSVIFTSIAILSAIQAISALMAAIIGFKQEGYCKGLIAMTVMLVSSFWTVIIPVISIILMIHYVRSKGSFYY